MRLFHTADVHYCDKYADEADRCLRAGFERACEMGIDAWAITGDFFDGSVTMHSKGARMGMAMIRDMARVAPGIILQGTASHDIPGSLDPLSSIPRVLVVDRICQAALVDGVWAQSKGSQFEADVDATFLFSCLPPVNKAELVAASNDEAVADHLGHVLRQWAGSHVAARGKMVPTVLLTHGTINGCLTESMVPMHGLDHEFTVGSLFAAEADVAAAGHIHKHQVWRDQETGRAVAYPGSPGRYHHGERGDKGVIYWEFMEHGPVMTFIKTPAVRLIEIEFEGPVDMTELKAALVDAVGARVRVRYAVDEEHSHAVQPDAIRKLAKEMGVASIKVEGTVTAVKRARSSGIAELGTLAEKVSRWCESTEIEAGGMLQKLALLERQAPVEDMVKEAGR